MAVKRVSAVVGTGSLGPSVKFWTAVLGAAPTFVDGDRWAQFDVAGSRLSVGAGPERPTAPVAVMVAVDDLDSFCAAASAAGLSIGEVLVGAHEKRVALMGPSGEEVIAYQAIQSSPAAANP